MRRSFLILALCPVWLTALSYEVEFLGLCDKEVLKALRDASQLVHLQERPPPSINGLRYRASSDLPALVDVLHAFAYYEAHVSYEIGGNEESYQVKLYIDPGPQYLLTSYDVFLLPNCQEKTEIAGLEPPVCRPALSVDIVNTELELLSRLAGSGYPLAIVEKRRVEVNMETKTVEAAACIEKGPEAKFGPMTFYGLKGVDPRFVERRIGWKEGDLYNADLLEQTQQRLLQSDLFSSVLISHGEEIDPLGELPMKMRLSEVKHRQFSIGVFYATIDGFGGTVHMVNRNLRGMGETLSLDGDFSKRWLGGAIQYRKPDFLTYNQTYRALAALAHESIRPYHATTYRFANYLDRKFDPRTSFSVGLKIEHLTVTDSADNGSYLLTGLPLFVKYDASNGELDPTAGCTVVYQATPYQSLDHSNQHFIKQRLTGTAYVPLRQNKNIVFAMRIQLGSIGGAKQTAVPLPKLFLGGSEDDLRGYRYKTVSPLNADGQPLGGRSTILASLEMRARLTRTIGFVPFADFGTVSLSQVPQLHTKWFKSVGVGIRYFAFFGPLRFDVGFPLDRRKGIDSHFQIYAAVGQAF